MTNADITASWLREVMARHDPLAVWEPGVAHLSDYARESETAVAGMRRVLGLGHVWTLVADAIDASHPGFYRAARADDGELRRRVALIAREAWDRHAWAVPGARVPLPLPAGPPPPAPPAQAMITDPTVLRAWLRQVEERLEAETGDGIPGARPTALALRAALPGLVAAYGTATDEQRDDTREVFSRNVRARYQLAWFAGEQLEKIQGVEGVRALRHALLAESLLDMGLDWRDELLLLRDLRDRSRATGLPFDDLLAEAAACSTARTSEFLLGVAREAR